MFKPKQSLGQNFLIDANIARKIVKTARINSEDEVWEIGSGKGILTKALLDKTSNIICFEIDNYLAEYLQQRLKVNVINSDILKVDWQNFFHKKKIKIVANIPYHITSPLLFKILKFKDYFSQIVLMIQKEVAERLTAGPGTKNYSALSVKIQSFFRIYYEFRVKSHLFYPKPKVDSAVIRMLPKHNDMQNRKAYLDFVKQCFSMRRKTLRNNLKPLFAKQKLAELVSITETNLQRRAETLTIQEFKNLYKDFQKISFDYFSK